jgi:hypothetical protein
LITSIYDLAELAVSKFGLKGIDWAALTAAGRGTVWDRDYINNYMVPAQIAMITNVGGMTFDVGGDPTTNQQAYSTSENVLQSIASSVLPLANLPSPELMTVQVGLSREAVRYVVSHAYQAANYAFLLHADETIHHSGLSDAEIAAHANTAVGTMNALVMLRNIGLYRALGIDESQKPTSGLGIAPALLVAIVVVAIAALAIFAWVIVSLVDLTKKNATVAKVCANAQAAGDAATTQQCISTLTDPNKNAGTQIPNAIKQTLLSLVPYALGGVAIYALYLSAPYIVKNLLTKKATA